MIFATEWSFDEFSALLTRLDACVLADWDREFVNDLIHRVENDGCFSLESLTIRQVEQLQRMEGQYSMNTSKRSQGGKITRDAPQAAEPRARGPEDEGSANTFLGGNAVPTLAEYIRQAEKLLEARDTINQDVTQIVKSVKSLGVIPQVFRKILQRRRMDAEKRRAIDDQLTTCEELLRKYL